MRYLATVRYGSMAFVGDFVTRVAGLRARDRVVIRTERGVEIGTVVSPGDVIEDGEEKETEQTEEQARTDLPAGSVGEILRRMTPDDLAKQDEIEEQDQPREFDFCMERIKARDLPMKLASVEHLFGGTKIIFYFVADGRVDFRELVKDLAQEYHCRIEMRQIGVRDEARLLADYEHCGRPLCCRTFVKKLEPVSMKMAKSQKATLDPAKISGRCGRLMCCLRFEDDLYEELRRASPRKHTARSCAEASLSVK
jgi:cell fate regulator YaaT (PSP1 superfamily)